MAMASWGYGSLWNGDHTTHRNSGGRYVRVYDCRKRHWSRALKREHGGVAGVEVGENRALHVLVVDTAAAAVGTAAAAAADVAAAVGTPVAGILVAGTPAADGGLLCSVGTSAAGGDLLCSVGTPAALGNPLYSVGIVADAAAAAVAVAAAAAAVDS